MITSENGWATSGDRVLYTEDGGTHWYDVTPPDPVLLDPDADEQVNGAFFDEEHAWIVFADLDRPPRFLTIWITDDAGRSWTPKYDFPGWGSEFLVVHLRVIDPMIGWLLADWVVMGTGRNDMYGFFHSVDGGTSWTELRMWNSVVTDIEFADPSTGWVTLEVIGPYADPVEPDIMITHDGGENWETLDLPPPVQDPELFGRFRFCSTYSAELYTPDSGFLVVGCFNSLGGPDFDPEFTSYLYRTSDGGATWQTNLLPLSIRGGATVIFFGPSEGLLLGETLYQTHDAGQTWEMIRQVSWQGQFSFIDPMRGWAVAQTDTGSAFLRTTDRGQTWSLLETVIASR
jgi:photosystem II stability/assembly factor-like uncharacterized protein